MKLEAEKIAKSNNLKCRGIPCVDCLIFPICNSIVKTQLYILDPGIILYPRCSLLRNFINEYEDTVLITSVQDDISYTNISIDLDKLALVTTYFKEVGETNYD